MLLVVGQAACPHAYADDLEAKKLETKYVADRAALTGALTRRANLAAAIAGGETTPKMGLALLNSREDAYGLKVSAEVGFALAAMDVGQRLVAFGKQAEAEAFFQAAEATLQQVVEKTPDASAVEKAQYLANLGFIRSRFLNKEAQAKGDLEAARRLSPKDKSLEGLLKAAASRNREVFTEKTSRKE